MEVIGGDIGGTKTRLGLFEITGRGITKLGERTYAGAASAGLAEIATAFLAEMGAACERAAFAVAGPVDGRTARTSNLPWRIDADEMERDLALPRVYLLNDLEAVAYGLHYLGEEDLLTLNPGMPGATATFAAKGIARGAACEPVRGAAGVDRDGGDAG